MALFSRQRRGGHGPGDYESELVKLVGSAGRADEMIRAEMARRPEFSRVGAALALVTRLRHRRDGYAKPL
jgi:hypothetical protein